jgi:hypothetical protein
MADYDTQVLEQAYQAMYLIDLRYRQANLKDKVKLQPDRDEAFNGLIAARIKLLEDGMICTKQDVAKMAELKEEIRQAVQTQALLKAMDGVIKLLDIF